MNDFSRNVVLATLAGSVFIAVPLGALAVDDDVWVNSYSAASEDRISAEAVEMQEVNTAGFSAVELSSFTVGEIRATVDGETVGSFRTVRTMDYPNTIGLSGNIALLEDGNSTYMWNWWRRQKRYPYIRKDVTLTFFDFSGKLILSHGFMNAYPVGYELEKVDDISYERVILHYEEFVGVT